MKNIFLKGDRKVYTKTITDEDLVVFHGEMLHAVYSTYSLARDFEWSSRLFFIEMKEVDEDGVGTLLHIDHQSPAFAGEVVVITATADSIKGNELLCTIEACVGDRVIARGMTGQKMVKKEKLKAIFSKP